MVKVSVLDHDVEVVDSFVYLGSCIDVHGGSEPDICRRIEKARSCMKSLDRNIWRSSISLQTKIRLYNVYILPILLYGADTWSMTVASSRRFDSFDNWCLPRCLVDQAGLTPVVAGRGGLRGPSSSETPPGPGLGPTSESSRETISKER